MSWAEMICHLILGQVTGMTGTGNSRLTNIENKKKIVKLKKKVNKLTKKTK
jgi:hypothetical protein